MTGVQTCALPISASPILEDARSVWGFVQVSRSTAPLRASIQTTWLTLVGAAGLVLAGSALGALVVARQIARPVRALTVATRAVAAGDLALYVQPSGPIETRVLADSFNRMSTQVRETLAHREVLRCGVRRARKAPVLVILAGQGGPGLARGRRG